MNKSEPSPGVWILLALVIAWGFPPTRVAMVKVVGRMVSGSASVLAGFAQDKDQSVRDAARTVIEESGRRIDEAAPKPGPLPWTIRGPLPGDATELGRLPAPPRSLANLPPAPTFAELLARPAIVPGSEGAGSLPAVRP